MIKKGMKVKILTGKDKSKEGEVMEIDRKNNRVSIDLYSETRLT
jgi:large subunit ribosomal protein L24